MSAFSNIAKALPALSPIEGADGRTLTFRKARPARAKPVLQFVSLPLTIDPSPYVGARSNTNPNGDLRPLRAFRDLVDPLPSLTNSFFVASSRSTEGTYEMILQGAVAGDDRFAQTIVNRSRQQFAEASFANLDGTLGEWRPVYASPADWPTSAADRFTELEIDLRNDTDMSGGAYTLLGAPSLRLSCSSGGSCNLDPDTELERLRVKILLVQLSRPWLNPMLFEIAGWRLPLDQRPDPVFAAGRRPIALDGTALDVKLSELDNRTTPE
jgi:hypothetical protein